MKINFLGDSITEGAFAGILEDRYSTLTAKHFGAEEAHNTACAEGLGNKFGYHAFYHFPAGRFGELEAELSFFGIDFDIAGVGELGKEQFNFQHGCAVFRDATLTCGADDVGLAFKIQLPQGFLIKAHFHGMAFFSFFKNHEKAVAFSEEQQARNAFGVVVLHETAKQRKYACVVLAETVTAFEGVDFLRQGGGVFFQQTVEQPKAFIFLWKQGDKAVAFPKMRFGLPKGAVGFFVFFKGGFTDF